MTKDTVIAEFEPSKESVRWAQTAIQELDREAAAFFKSDVTEIITQIDAQSNEHIQKVRLKQKLPSGLARKATEALTNSRHAFDQAAFAARNIVSGRGNDSVYYPWARSPIDLSHRLKNMDQRLWTTFQLHEPYPRSDAHVGGNDVIRALARLANDKHTVGLGVNGHIRSMGHPPIVTRQTQFIGIRTPKWDPDKNEAELMRWIGNPKIGCDYQFAFEIVLKDAGLAHPVNAVAGLIDFSAKANTVIETLQARCLEIVAA